MITIAIQCHNFQRRLSWMLSSLAAQTNAQPITVDISMVQGNGTPTTEYICDLYESERLAIVRSFYDLKTLQYRGLTRNGAIERCKTEWLLFADCDMVYHPEFYSKLHTYLINESVSYIGNIFLAGRRSTDIGKTNQLVAEADYSAPINHPWRRTYRRLNDSSVSRPAVGAGYFQLINLKHCNHGGYYVAASLNRDYGWIEGAHCAKANSDWQFRRRIAANRRIPKWFGDAQIHLNHERDNGNGLRAATHLEDQR